jgi:carboxypeptidase Q
MKITACLVPALCISAFAVCLSAHAAEKSATDPAPAQPAVETLDLATIAQIRNEGFNHSRVMEYASGLFDGIGPRLTGSPDFAKASQWSVDQLRRMGAFNPHEESWGDFGMGWQQIGTSALMVTPSTATILAQATPWSPDTAGEKTAEVIAVPNIEDEKGIEKWKGKLAGKIILYGDAPKNSPDPENPLQHYDAAKLDHFASYPLDGDQSDSYVLPTDPAIIGGFFKQMAFKEKVARFFADEHAIAVLVPGGFRGEIHDDTDSSMGWWVYKPEKKQPIPSAVIASEAIGRMLRLVSHDVPVTLRLNIATKFTGDHVDGSDVIADIPGTDTSLKDQVVMMGGHLDSWIAGTGATDDGAGAIIALEAMRILKALNIQPRRTIRIGLWGGEEQGIFGSAGYVSNHFATFSYSSKPEDQAVPTFVRQQTAPMTLKPEHATFDAYFNADNGTGKFLGIFAEGNSQAASIFEQWGAPIKDLGFTTISERNTGSTDHVSFQLAGLPGFQFIQDPRDYLTVTHHTNQDVYERLSESDLKQASVIMATFVYNAAQRDAMMPRMPLPHPELEPQKLKPLEGIYPTAAKPAVSK